MSYLINAALWKIFLTGLAAEYLLLSSFSQVFSPVQIALLFYIVFAFCAYSTWLLFNLANVMKKDLEAVAGCKNLATFILFIILGDTVSLFIGLALAHNRLEKVGFLDVGDSIGQVIGLPWE